MTDAKREIGLAEVLAYEAGAASAQAELTPVGYCVEDEVRKGSVHVYPERQLVRVS